MVDLPFIRLDSSHPTAGAGWTAPARQPRLLLRSDGIRAVVTGDQTATWDNPLQALDWMARTFPAPGRWIGYLSYDLGRWFEVLPAVIPDDLNLPLFAFAFIPDDAPPMEPPASAEQAALQPPAPREVPVRVRSNFTRTEYLAAVARVIDYIAAGDIFQVNLSQRLSIPTPLNPLAIYQRLLATTPAWYGGLLDFGDFALVSNSPELFFHVTPDGRIATRPIKGTRPRAPGMAKELQQSIKDQAELNMIVDLERNDLGRICQIGSVRVTEPRAIEAHPTVYHGAATIEGQLRPGIGFVDVLRAIFPGGSITGAPKIRAMEIIEELEPCRRGPYCGAIGFIDHTGTIMFNIAIRTLTLKNQIAYIPVGGGIVADSQPQPEYDETLVKARALLRALGIESATLD